jgi:hypothetical protein
MAAHSNMDITYPRLLLTGLSKTPMPHTALFNAVADSLEIVIVLLSVQGIPPFKCPRFINTLENLSMLNRQDLQYRE